MDLAQIFYIIMIFAGITFIGGVIFIAYQVYLIKVFITEKFSFATKFVESIAATKYTTQYLASKFLLKFFKGGDEE